MAFRRLTREEIDGIPDEYERLAAQLFHDAGLEVCEAPVIVAPKDLTIKGRRSKRATVPDMVVLDANDTRYVEITRSDVTKDPRKRHQRGVMTRAGLGNQYIQLGGQEMESLMCTSDEIGLLEKILTFLRLR